MIQRRSKPTSESDRPCARPGVHCGSAGLLTPALDHIRRGEPVFPCAPGAKTPLTSRGYLSATTDETTVRRWWCRWPEANIGLPTGAPRSDVLDVDVRASGSGWAALAALWRGRLLDGAHRLVRTPCGGLHIYFLGSRQPSRGLRGLHLDFKATGGYVLVPPSRVVTPEYAGSYQILDEVPRADALPLDWSAVESLLAPAPTRRFRPGQARGIRRLAAYVASQREGNRNACLFWAANRAIEAGATDLQPLVDSAKLAGLAPEEASATVESAQRTCERGS